jgi:hypothetical protein
MAPCPLHLNLWLHNATAFVNLVSVENKPFKGTFYSMAAPESAIDLQTLYGKA